MNSDAGKGPTSAREAQVPRNEDRTSEILSRDEAATAGTSDVAGDAPAAPFEAAEVVVTVTEDSDVGGRGQPHATSRDGKGSTRKRRRGGAPSQELEKEKECSDPPEKRGASSIEGLRIETRGRGGPHNPRQ